MSLQELSFLHLDLKVLLVTLVRNFVYLTRRLIVLTVVVVYTQGWLFYACISQLNKYLYMTVFLFAKCSLRLLHHTITIVHGVSSFHCDDW